jgi:hypothetical protein
MSEVQGKDLLVVTFLCKGWKVYTGMRGNFRWNNHNYLLTFQANVPHYYYDRESTEILSLLQFVDQLDSFGTAASVKDRFTIEGRNMTCLNQV